jgi:hypothetical protein
MVSVKALWCPGRWRESTMTGVGDGAVAGWWARVSVVRGRWV